MTQPDGTATLPSTHAADDGIDQAIAEHPYIHTCQSAVIGAARDVIEATRAVVETVRANSCLVLVVYSITMLSIAMGVMYGAWMSWHGRGVPLAGVWGWLRAHWPIVAGVQLAAVVFVGVGLRREPRQ